ncbi:MAG: VWA domain-containing protein [Planctomycetes bacterium]|nr:VWA domain-containing protein [Planctomycetota bacterium]
MITAASIAVLAAAPGLLLVRTAPPWARLVALLSMLLLAAALTMPPSAVTQTVPGAVGFATTTSGDLPPSIAAELQRAGALLRAHEPAGERGLATAIAAAHTHARSGPEPVHVLWNGPMRAAVSDALRADLAFSTTPALPFAPDSLQLSWARTPQVGRPTLLAVALRDLPMPAAITVTVGGEPVLTGTSSATVEGAWTPSVPGEHELEVRAQIGPHLLVRQGRLTIAAAPAITVVDPSGVAAAALRAQGLSVVTAAVVPADLRGVPALVLATAVDVATQERIVGAVGDGMGLLVVAPAFVPLTEPLASLLPIRPLPDAVADGSGTGSNQPGDRPRRDPPPANDPPGPRPDQPPPSADRPPSGDTSEATPDPGGPSEVDKHAVAMMLVVDRSGSMGEALGLGLTKMDYARTSASRTAQQLSDGDAIGVVTFGNKDQARIALPLTAVGDPGIAPAIAQLRAFPNEQTYLLDGIRRAAAELKQRLLPVRHIVVISDGEFYGEDVSLRAEAARLRREGITLGIISFISTETPSLFKARAEELARIGGGLFTATEDPTRVPVHVSAEVVRALDRVGRRPRTDADLPGTGPGTGESTPSDPKPDEPVPPEPKPPVELPPPPPSPPQPPRRLTVRAVAKSPLLAPLPTVWPTLGAAVPCTAPLDAHVLLVVGDDGAPLLAFGNRGLGRVAAFAADPAAPAAAEFVADPAFAARLAQWLQAVLPPEPRLESRLPLGEPVVTPVAPNPAELRQLAAMASGEVVDVAQFAAPPPHAQTTFESQLARWAMIGLAALLLLAIAERIAAHRLSGR